MARRIIPYRRKLPQSPGQKDLQPRQIVPCVQFWRHGAALRYYLSVGSLNRSLGVVGLSWLTPDIALGLACSGYSGGHLYGALMPVHLSWTEIGATVPVTRRNVKSVKWISSVKIWKIEPPSVPMLATWTGILLDLPFSLFSP